VIDVFLPPMKDASRLELVINGSVMDTFVPGGTGAVRDIRSAAPAPRRRGAAAAAAEDVDADPVMTWKEAGAATRRRGAGGAGPTYTVQVSTDDGKTWLTAGFGLREPRVTLDRQAFGDADTVRVRVTATNGFQSSTSEKTLKVSDL
jgi:hypothetical protein